MEAEKILEEYKEQKYLLNLNISLKEKKYDLLIKDDIDMNLKREELESNSKFQIKSVQKRNEQIYFHLIYQETNQDFYIVYLKKGNLIENFNNFNVEKTNCYLFFVGLLNDSNEFKNSKYFLSSNYNKNEGIGLLGCYINHFNKRYLIHLLNSFYLDSLNLKSDILIPLNYDNYNESDLLTSEFIFLKNGFRKIYTGPLGGKYYFSGKNKTYIGNNRTIYLKPSLLVSDNQNIKSNIHNEEKEEEIEKYPLKIFVSLFGVIKDFYVEYDIFVDLNSQKVIIDNEEISLINGEKKIYEFEFKKKRLTFILDQEIDKNTILKYKNYQDSYLFIIGFIRDFKDFSKSKYFITSYFDQTLGGIGILSLYQSKEKSFVDLYESFYIDPNHLISTIYIPKCRVKTVNHEHIFINKSFHKIFQDKDGNRHYFLNNEKKSIDPYQNRIYFMPLANEIEEKVFLKNITSQKTQKDFPVTKGEKIPIVQKEIEETIMISGISQKVFTGTKGGKYYFSKQGVKIYLNLSKKKKIIQKIPDSLKSSQSENTNGNKEYFSHMKETLKKILEIEKEKSNERKNFMKKYQYDKFKKDEILFVKRIKELEKELEYCEIMLNSEN